MHDALAVLDGDLAVGEYCDQAVDTGQLLPAVVVVLEEAFDCPVDAYLGRVGLVLVLVATEPVEPVRGTPVRRSTSKVMLAGSSVRSARRHAVSPCKVSSRCGGVHVARRYDRDQQRAVGGGSAVARRAISVLAVRVYVAVVLTHDLFVVVIP